VNSANPSAKGAAAGILVALRNNSHRVGPAQLEGYLRLLDRDFLDRVPAHYVAAVGGSPATHAVGRRAARRTALNVVLPQRRSIPELGFCWLRLRGHPIWDAPLKDSEQPSSRDKDAADGAGISGSIASGFLATVDEFR
jgi:hypothetical protein